MNPLEVVIWLLVALIASSVIKEVVSDIRECSTKSGE